MDNQATLEVNDGVDEVEEDEEETWDDWGEEDPSLEKTKSLFYNTELPSVSGCIAYDSQKYSFNLATFCKQKRLDDLGRIKLINYIRSEISKMQDPLKIISQQNLDQVPWESEQYLQPVLENDPLLWYDFDELNAEQNAGDEVGELQYKLKRQVEALQAEVDALRAANKLLQQESLAVFEERHEKTDQMDYNNASNMNGRVHERSIEDQKEMAKIQIDKVYFDSYSRLGIHREMLEDKVRTLAYKDAIMQCSAIQNGIVLDVGCGTGILSLFCKREGGAKRVIGVDASAEIAVFARQNMEDNGYTVREEAEIVSGKVEECTLPLNEDEKVDAIVSEWMGFALLFETMLNSVLWARDRYLKPGGLLLPCSARIFVAGASESAVDVDFWEDVYGFKMTSMADSIKQHMLKEPIISDVDPSCLVTTSACLKEFDLNTMREQDTCFTQAISLKHLSVALDVPCAAVVLWFDVTFPQDKDDDVPPVQLSTSPHNPKTHWRQTVFRLEQPLFGDAEEQCIKMRIGFVKGSQERSLDVSIEYDGYDEKGDKITKVRVYNMSVQ